MRRRRRIALRFERFVLGTVMGGIAFVIERKLLKAIKEKGEGPPTKAKPRKGTFTPGPDGPTVAGV